MIDIENDVFDFVYPYVSPVVPEGGFKSEYVHNMSEFPCATLIEMENETDTAFRSTADEEDLAILTYEANAYALNKQECRDVMAAIDSGMNDLGFTRVSLRFVPNFEDISVYRMVGRYRANADRNKVIYRRR